MAGYTVIAHGGGLQSGPLPHNTSAQKTGLIALTQALTLTKDESKYLS